MVLPVRARLSGVQEWTPEYPIKFYTRLVRAVHFERYWSDKQGKCLLFIIILEVQLQWMGEKIAFNSSHLNYFLRVQFMR